MDTRGRVRSIKVIRIGVKRRRHPPTFLFAGSIAPRIKPRTNWKAECLLLRVENEDLKEKLRKCEETAKEHATRFSQFQTTRCENPTIQIGDNNNMLVINNSLDEMLYKYEEIVQRVKEDASQRESLEEKLKDLSSKLKDLTETIGKREQMPEEPLHCPGQLHELADSEQACPFSSFTMMLKQTADVSRTLKLMQGSIESLSSMVDGTRLEFLKIHSQSLRSLSTQSLNDGQLLHQENRCNCERRVNSEIQINTRV